MIVSLDTTMNAGVSAPATAPALAGRRLTRRFGGLTAVDNVDISIPQQSIVGVIGPNGAGKTTLLNMLSGAIKPTSGNVLLAGKDVTKLGPTQRAAAGLRRTFQNIRLFSQMSIMENVLVGQHVKLRGWVVGGVLRGRTVRACEAAARDNAMEVLDVVGLDHDPTRLAGELSYGDQRRLELARALAADPTVLLLDEPAAGLNSAEKSRTAELILELPGLFGVTVVLVEHDMDLVSRTCQQVTVLDYGIELCSGTPHTVLNDPRVIEAYIGVEADE
jgi:branched-chain amino acid transport system ATP-binding protein